MILKDCLLIITKGIYDINFPKYLTEHFRRELNKCQDYTVQEFIDKMNATILIMKGQMENDSILKGKEVGVPGFKFSLLKSISLNDLEKVEQALNKLKATGGTHWQELLKEHVVMITQENYIKEDISIWKKQKDKVGCATFCELLAEKGFLIDKKQKTIIDFAKSKYECDILMNGKERKKERNKNIKRFKHLF